MIVSAIVIVGYTSLGGFNAASVTDLIQSIIMTVALVIVLIFGVSKAGGIDAVMNNAHQLNGYLDLFAVHHAEGNTSTAFGAISVVASVWVVISMFIAIAIGIVGRGMVTNGAIEHFKDSETIIIQISNALSQEGIVPALIAGVILAGILASTMSTSDSQLLAASSSASENLLGGLFKLDLSETAKMIVARLTLVIISVIGVVIAWDSNSSVFGIVSFAWAGFGAAFGPVVLLSLFWKRSNKYGAIAGVFAGGAMVFLWKFVIAGLSPIFNIYELLPAFLTGLAVNVIVSLCTKAPDEDIVKAFEEVKKIK